MIKNVIFDMGRVLAEFETDRATVIAGVRKEDAALFGSHVYQSTYWYTMDRGILGEDEGIKLIENDVPERLKSKVEAAVKWYKYEFLPIEEMGEFIEELHEKEYKIYYLSNARPFIHEYFNKIPASKYFDGGVFSCDTGYIKPEHEIYEILFSKYNLKPEECFFVDDGAVNIEAGINLGMPGTVFRGNMEDLRKAFYGYIEN